jgi:hypothetical protein
MNGIATTTTTAPSNTHRRLYEFYAKPPVSNRNLIQMKTISHLRKPLKTNEATMSNRNETSVLIEMKTIRNLRKPLKTKDETISNRNKTSKWHPPPTRPSTRRILSTPTRRNFSYNEPQSIHTSFWGEAETCRRKPAPKFRGSTPRNTRASTAPH